MAELNGCHNRKTSASRHDNQIIREISKAAQLVVHHSQFLVTFSRLLQQYQCAHTIAGGANLPMSIPNSEVPDDDAKLALQARTDVNAFAELYRRHVTRVYRYHMAHTGNLRDAEDLTSQTFMAALEGIRSYRGSGSFAAWIMGIAVRKQKMYYRGSRPESSLEAALHIPNPGLPPDQEAARRLEVERVQRALKRINPERAEALILRYFGGLDIQEIARALGKSQGAVKMLITRGLKDLRERTLLALEVEQ